MMQKGTILTVILILGLFVILFWALPPLPASLSFVIGAGVAFILVLYYIFAVAAERRRIKGRAIWIPVISLSFLGLVLPVAFAGILYLQGMFSLIGWLLMIALTFTFFLYFLTIPLAFYRKYQETKDVELAFEHPPSVTVLVPAYNEEKVLRRTLECILEASYPDKEIIVIDDGSTDRTYQIALGFSDRGVKVFHRPNGGKSAALNFGLLFAQGEIIITIDADSLIGKNALVEMIRPFQDPEVAATAGNIKVLNRKNLLTNCQAVEYIVCINIFRKALDVFGKIPVVPGCLGAYRRNVLEGSGFYDPDTLVEDFDVTVKTLKAGRVVQASSSALCYTEAPETLSDFIKQRLRWYRGTFQVMWKHRDAGLNTRFGFLQRLTSPYMLVTALFMPFAALVVIASVTLTILSGVGITWLLYIFLFFLALQFLLTILAIQLDEDDMKLALYSPLFVIGYKHLCDFLMIKSLFDVLLRRQMKWERVKRIGNEPQKVERQ